MNNERYREIDKMMLMLPTSFSRRWCEPGELGCACMGCANNSGGLLKAGVTKEEWESWKRRAFV